MRILLTNDDGIEAPGIAAMYREIADLGQVHVVAPMGACSGSSHAVTVHRSILTRRVPVLGPATAQVLFEGVAVDGWPADCVKLGCSHIFDEPVDVVISGINSGANIGINVTYSGTVAAAREAAIIGIPAIAVSLHIGDPEKTNWPRAATIARQMIEKLIAGPLDRHGLVNLNVPILDDGAEPAGVRVEPVCTAALVDQYDRRTSDDGDHHYRAVEGMWFHNLPPRTDVGALFDRYITVTPLHFDPTQHELIEAWQRHLAG